METVIKLQLSVLLLEVAFAVFRCRGTLFSKYKSKLKTNPFFNLTDNWFVNRRSIANK